MDVCVYVGDVIVNGGAYVMMMEAKCG
jgi:hypothetical protein